MTKLKGSFVALITPFTKKSLEIDEVKLRELINFQIESGTDGIVAVGTTGESATLSKTEHRRVLEITIDEVKGRIPVIAGTGSNATREAVSLTEFAKEKGADFGLSISPYYNKPTQDGIVAHYSKIAEVGLPTILYNVPGRTSRNVEAATTLELAKNPSLVGIKEASGDLKQIEEICQKKPADFAVISGEDAQTLEIIKLGGAGAIGVIQNEVPGEMKKMIDLALASNFEAAEKINTKFANLMDLNFVDNNPIDVKWILSEMGKIEYAVRLPLTEPSAENKAKIQEELKKIGLV
ncbi:MAG: 4-hydroxy-tetrahydrodipicolinate synthase [Candidatus Peribacteraceae bacterium]|nr:4-hydroxy-tetrahydrodipicolinate synthase [Candidatus Peribacteraceae bacterium]